MQESGEGVSGYLVSIPILTDKTVIKKRQRNWQRPVLNTETNQLIKNNSKINRLPPTITKVKIGLLH